MKVYPALICVTPFEDYQLALTFEGNVRRIYDFKPNLSHKYYKPLTDMRLFNAVSVVDGEIMWATGQDFCPHTLHDQSVPVNADNE